MESPNDMVGGMCNLILNALGNKDNGKKLVQPHGSTW